MTKPNASLSLDLDNRWSYLKIHGDAGWESHPSYLDVVVPRFLDMFRERALRLTVFIVGQDAALKKNHDALRSIAEAGHDIGNHSFEHEPWMNEATREQVHGELARAEDAIEGATGVRPTGFRGPGFACSENILNALLDRGYRYDASTFPTYLGPLARAYYFMTTRLDSEKKEERKTLFGGVRDGLRPVKPYTWALGDRELLEIPVTTLPGAKVPIHLSYVLYLAQISPRLAATYFEVAARVCRLTGTELSLLLHPLDFLGREDAPDLAFFPAMGVESAQKLPVVGRALDIMAKHFRVVSMAEHAEALLARGGLPRRAPDFAAA